MAESAAEISPSGARELAKSGPARVTSMCSLLPVYADAGCIHSRSYTVPTTLQTLVPLHRPEKKWRVFTPYKFDKRRSEESPNVLPLLALSHQNAYGQKYLVVAPLYRGTAIIVMLALPAEICVNATSVMVGSNNIVFGSLKDIKTFHRHPRHRHP
jgi:hypothetical protein